MALYKLSEVVLDSWMAGGEVSVLRGSLRCFVTGGCTTTREALEVGGIVVTMPCKYLGGRWSLAYLNHIGVRDTIAESKEEYVRIAVAMATNASTRSSVRERIMANFPKLMKSNEAVKEWENVLLKMNEKTFNE